MAKTLKMEFIIKREFYRADKADVYISKGVDKKIEDWLKSNLSSLLVRFPHKKIKIKIDIERSND